MDLGLDPQLAADLRRADPDRFWCLVPARPEHRPALAGLILLNQELGRVAEQTRQPMIGFIRLQWWRDVLDELAAGDVRRHPMVEALPPLLKVLAPDEIEPLIDARERDLDDAPMADLPALTAYAASTAGALQVAMAKVAGDDPARAHAIGTAFGVIGIVRATAHLARHGRVLLPEDLLVRHGLGRDDVLAGRNAAALGRAIAETVVAARTMAAPLRPRRGESASALLLVLRHQLKALAGRGHDPLAASIAPAPLLPLRLLVLQTIGR